LHEIQRAGANRRFRADNGRLSGKLLALLRSSAYGAPVTKKESGEDTTADPQPSDETKSSADDDAKDAAASEQEEDEGEDEDKEDAGAASAKPSSKPRRVDGKKRKALSTIAKSTAPAKPRERAARSEARETGDSPKLSPAVRGAILVVAGLAVGVGGGWLLREAKLKGRAPFSGPKAAASGVSSECKDWEEKICAESGAESAGCAQAHSAAELLPVSACSMALQEVPATLSRIKEVRQVCTDLVDKLCGDLGNDSPTCAMVRRRTETITPENCRSMQESYPEVIAQLRMMEQQGGMMRGGPGGGGPPGGMHPPMRPAPGGLPPGHPPAPSEP
jgi:hypothetical protein